MPKRKRTNGVGSKRTTKFRKRFRASVPSSRGFIPINNMRSLAPNKMLVNLRYSEQFAFVAGTAIATQVYSCNSLNDPNVTGAGHQPRGFDQWMALYDHYTVIYSNIVIKFMANTQSTSTSVIVLSVRDGQTVSGSLNTYRENSEIVEALVKNQNAGPSMLKIGVNPPRYLGRSKPLSDPQLKGASTTNPVEQVFYHITSSGLPAGNVSIPTEVLVTINYLAVLTEPKTPSQS